MCTGKLVGRSEPLAHEQVRVPARVIVHDRHDLEAALRVKRWGLESERHEKTLAATPSASLLLCCLKQRRSQSLFAARLLHPELANFQATAPCIPTDAGLDSILLVSQQDGQPLAICDARRCRVEFVNSIFQVLNLAWRGLCGDDECRGRHI